MMGLKGKTKRCVECGRKATGWGGIVWNTRKQHHVMAGKCNKHSGIFTECYWSRLKPHVIKTSKGYRISVRRHDGGFCLGCFEGEIIRG